jgi:hypothetical protein
MHYGRWKTTGKQKWGSLDPNGFSDAKLGENSVSYQYGTPIGV